jgi:hypothetical protein
MIENQIDLNANEGVARTLPPRGHSCPQQHGIVTAIGNSRTSDQSRTAADRIDRATSCIFLLAALLAHSVGVAASLDLDLASRAPAVGEYGNLSRVSFVGNRTFGEEALRRSLRADLDSVNGVRFLRTKPTED